MARRFDVEVRYEGPRGSWSTDETLPPIDRARDAETREMLVVPAPDGGRYLFAWGHLHRLRRAHSLMIWLVLALIVGVIVLAHELIRRSLRPLRTLREGVARLSAGELDVALPQGTRDEFGALTEAFNGMVRRVSEMVRARDQLLVDVSHELRSPLTRMKVALELLPQDEKQRRMKADVSEMETMLSELLERERLGDGRSIRTEPVDLVALLREAALSVEDAPPGVVVSSGEPELLVPLDADRVRVVLRNLLENAVKYALPDSRPIEVVAEREARRVVVRVRDDGPGIPEDELERVFEPFYRVDRSRSRRTGGYGLGLSICKRIMRTHGGDIVATRGSRRGVTFVLTFPEGAGSAPLAGSRTDPWPAPSG
jgi:signal transduction histidine kinase